MWIDKLNSEIFCFIEIDNDDEEYEREHNKVI